jgi:hypothetical protein
MMIDSLVRRACAAALAVTCLIAAPTHAQQQPSASAIATAKELLDIKGANVLFAPLVAGVVEVTKNTLLATNPLLGNDLHEVAARLKLEFAPRQAEVINELAVLFARNFTEQEMKEIIAFFKTSAGKKFLVDEPVTMQEGMARAEAWSTRLSEQVMARFRAEMKKKGHDL